MGEARGCGSFLFHGGSQRMRELFVPWGRPKDAGAFCSMGETKGCGSFLFHGGDQMLLRFFFTEGGEFKASLLAGERFGERFSRSREK